MARFGGEEFVVLLPNTGSLAAFHVAEKLRQGVSELQIAGLPPITISLGIADMGAPAAGASEGLARTAAVLLREADEALYEAKRGGRNRAVVYRAELQAGPA